MREMAFWPMYLLLVGKATLPISMWHDRYTVYRMPPSRNFFTVSLSTEFAKKSSLKIQRHRNSVATLPCGIFDAFLTIGQHWPASWRQFLSSRVCAAALISRRRCTSQILVSKYEMLSRRPRGICAQRWTGSELSR